MKDADDKGNTTFCQHRILYTQVLRLKSADSGSPDAGGAALRQSLSELGQEMEAVAEAMEAVNRGELSPVVPVAADDAAARDRQRERS